MTTILGIDPGSRFTGYGVIRLLDKKVQYLASGCVDVSKLESVPEKLHQIFEGLSEILHLHQPHQAAIEQVFMHANASSALKLGQARGVAIAAVAHHGLPIAEYSARQVKQAVVGHGGADKAQVQQMVKALLNLPKVPQADAADALAIALCHAHTGDSVKGIAGVSGVKAGRWR